MGEFDNYPCRDCGQEIFKSSYRFNRKGWNLKLNLNNGQGGKRGEEHICPNKVSTHKKQFVDIRTCEQCYGKYNLDLHPMCPTCFKLVCTGCGHIWNATRYNVYDKKGPYQLIRRCPKCGIANPELTFDKKACEEMRQAVTINRK